MPYSNSDRTSGVNHFGNGDKFAKVNVPEPNVLSNEDDDLFAFNDDNIFSEGVEFGGNVFSAVARVGPLIAANSNTVTAASIASSDASELNTTYGAGHTAFDATPAETAAAVGATGIPFSGSGLKIGVMSDSFNYDGLPTADLGYVTVLPVQSEVTILQDDTSSKMTDEGRAMMQVVHDIAPGASLDFYSAEGGDQAMANGITALANAGCKIICEDVEYLDAPWFQSGVITQAIQSFEQSGGIFVSCAGNQASAAYQSAWSSTNLTINGSNYNALNFGTAQDPTPYSTVTVPNGATANFLVQWAQPWDNATTNLELVVSQGGVVVYTAENSDNLGGETSDPMIYPASGDSFENKTGASETFQVSILNLGGPDPSLVKYMAYGDKAPITITGANAGTVSGDNESPYEITVGAVSAGNTPAFDDPIESEDFSSSDLGAEWLFNSAGGALSSPQLLSPITISGVDDVDASDIVGDTDYNSGFSDFFGTSCATPTVAAVVGDMLQANPNLTFAQIEQILEKTAIPFGVSDIAGSGLVNAAAAIQFADNDAPITIAEFVADQVYLDDGVPNGFPIADLVANVVAHFDALNADSHVIAITLTNSGTPVLNLTATQAANDTSAINEITNQFFGVNAGGSTRYYVTHGTVTLTGDNTFSGGLSVKTGATLSVAAGFTFLELEGAPTINDGLINIGANTTLYVEDSQISGDGAVNIEADGALWLSAKAGTTVNDSFYFDGAGQLFIGSGGTVALSTDNSPGSTTVVTGGTLSINSPTDIGAGALTLNGGSTLDLAGAFTYANRIDIDDGAATVDVSVNSAVLSGAILNGSGGAGALNVVGDGVLELTDDNSYSGGTSVTDSTLEIADASNIGGGSLSLSQDAVLELTASVTLFFDSMSISGVDTIEATGTNYLGGDITGAGELILSGGGTIELGGDNTYGETYVSGATLQIFEADNIGAGNLALVDDSTLDCNGSFTLMQAVEMTGLTTFVVAAGDNVQLSNELVDAGSEGILVLEGGGSLALSGENLFDGGAIIVAGRLEALDDYALGTDEAIFYSGTTLELGQNITIANTIGLAGVVDVQVEDDDKATISGVITEGDETGSLVIETGAVTLTGDNKYSGGTTVDGGATLTVGDDHSLGSGALTLENGATLDSDASLGFANAISISGTVSIDTTAAVDALGLSNISQGEAGSALIIGGEGQVELSGDGGYSGGTTIQSGATLFAVFDDALGSGGVTMQGPDATLILYKAPDFANAIGGLGLGDVIELPYQKPTGVSASVNSSNQLVVVQNGATLQTLNLSGNNSNLAFAIEPLGGGTGIVALPDPATVADYLADPSLYNSLSGGFSIDDAFANIEAGLTALEADDAHIASITATGGLVSVSEATWAADQGALDRIVGGFEVSDTLPIIISHLALFNADTHIDELAGASGSATLSGNVSVLAPEFALSGSGTALTVSENLSLSSLNVGTGSSVSVSQNDTLKLTGASTLSGAVSGKGTLSMSGGTDAVSVRQTVSNWSSAGAQITVANAMSYAGKFTEGAGDLLMLNGGLTLTAAATLAGAIAGAQKLTLDAGGTVSLALTVGGSGGLTSIGTMTQTGEVTLGDASGAAVTLRIGVGATWNIADNNGFGHGNSAASIVSNGGTLEKTAGTSNSVIAPSLIDTGTLAINTGGIDLTGAANRIAGAVTGTGILELDGGVTTLLSGASIAAPTLEAYGASTRLTVATAAFSYAGAFTLGADVTLGVSSGDTLTLTGTSLLEGSIAGLGALQMTGGTATISAGGTVSLSAWTSSGTTLDFVTGRNYGGAFTASNETIDLSGALTLLGASSLSDVTVDGSLALRLTGGATISGGLSLGGSTSLSASKTVTLSGGNVTLGDSSGHAIAVSDTAGSTFDITDNSGVVLGNSAVSSFANPGLIEKTGGTGGSAIATTVVNTGQLEAASGTLDFQQAITGKGADILSGAASLEFDGSVASTQTVEFEGANSVLDLTNWGTFSGSLTGFDKGGATGGTNDTIDVSTPWSWVGYSATTGMMTFSDNGTNHSVKLGSGYIAGDFLATPITGGTQVTYA